MRDPLRDSSARNVVQLADGRFARIDEEDFDRVSSHLWRVLGRGVPGTEIAGKSVLLRRFILNASAGVVINVNEDLLDCRRENLRQAPSIRVGSRGSSRGSSRYKGVSRVFARITRAKPWRAQISRDGKMRFLGYFAVEEAAARAYDAAAIAAWGHHARLNFPEQATA
jgi:hypothetical protein